MPNAGFLRSPWDTSHDAYKEAAFNIRPAPEFSTGEVVLSSLYRASGFSGAAEKNVTRNGNAFLKSIDRERRAETPAGKVQPDTWRTVLERVIQSPKVSQQSSKRFLSLSPVVPDTALYSGSARLAASPWNPGQLVQRIIQMGAPSPQDARSVWKELHKALTVQHDDDVWARWLQSEFEPRRLDAQQWQATELSPFDGFPAEERETFLSPAKQFVIDLQGVLYAKPAMTRRQWISLVEAVLRIGCVSHVLWLCDVNDKIWKVVRDLLGDGVGGVPTKDVVLGQILPVNRRMLSYGNPASPTIRDYASKYLSARLGINLVLWTLDELGTPIPSLRSAGDIASLFDIVRANARALNESRVVDSYFGLLDDEARAITCKKGIGVNLVEFCQYTLGQRQTMDESLRGYDQGYFLRRRGKARNSRWILAPGPAAVLAMAHCCLHEVNGPRSVQRLSVHLGAYGIEFDLHGLNDSDIGRQLRMLGLVLDSPDAESGMLLVPPFAADMVAP
jgi:hypothetical protein